MITVVIPEQSLVLESVKRINWDSNLEEEDCCVTAQSRGDEPGNIVGRSNDPTACARFIKLQGD